MNIGRKLVITLLVLLCFLGGAIHGAYTGWKYYARNFAFSSANYIFELIYLDDELFDDIDVKGKIAAYEHVNEAFKKRYIFDVEDPDEDVKQSAVNDLVLIYGRLAMAYEQTGEKNLSEKNFKIAVDLVKKSEVLQKYNITSTSGLITYINKLDSPVTDQNSDNPKDVSIN